MGVEKLKKRGKAAGFVDHCPYRRSPRGVRDLAENGNQEQSRTLKQLKALDKWKALLNTGHERVRALLDRLERLTRYRLHTKTKVLLCTVDSTERMVREMEEGTRDATLALGTPLFWSFRRAWSSTQLSWTRWRVSLRPQCRFF